MSKSLGNSPDPLDIIDKYGTDAFRFTLVMLSPPGRDVFFAEEKLETGRNFVNKLWQASRLVLGAVRKGGAELARRRTRAARSHRVCDGLEGRSTGASSGSSPDLDVGGPLDPERARPLRSRRGRRTSTGGALNDAASRALRLLLERVLRLVPRARQDPSLRRGRQADGPRRAPLYAGRIDTDAPPVPALRDGGTVVGAAHVRGARVRKRRIPGPRTGFRRRGGRQAHGALQGARHRRRGTSGRSTA